MAAFERKIAESEVEQNCFFATKNKDEKPILTIISALLFMLAFISSTSLGKDMLYQLMLLVFWLFASFLLKNNNLSLAEAVQFDKFALVKFDYDDAVFFAAMTDLTICFMINFLIQLGLTLVNLNSFYKTFAVWWWTNKFHTQGSFILIK